MSSKVQVFLLCDMEHEAETEATETVRLGVDGRAYEIDLCGKDAAQLRRKAGKYVKSARKVRHPSRGTSGSPRADRRRVAEIREWARSQGLDVSERGRIPAYIVERYSAAH